MFFCLQFLNALGYSEFIWIVFMNFLAIADILGTNFIDKSSKFYSFIYNEHK